MRKLTEVLAKNKNKIVRGGLLLIGTTIATLIATSVAEVVKPDYEEFEDDIYEAGEETIIDMEDSVVEEED